MFISKYIYKDLNYRLLFKDIEKKKKLINFIYNSISISKLFKTQIYIKLNFFKKDFLYIRNRCIFTGYSRSVFKHISMSRFYLKKLANTTYLYGFKKL